jgi:hypothetical protein
LHFARSTIIELKRKYKIHDTVQPRAEHGKLPFSTRIHVFYGSGEKYLVLKEPGALKVRHLRDIGGEKFSRRREQDLLCLRN